MNRPGLSFSHVGFFVHDLARMEDFYSRILEFTVTDRGQLPGPSGPLELVFLSRDPDEHHQIVLISGRPREIAFKRHQPDLAEGRKPGDAQGDASPDRKRGPAERDAGDARQLTLSVYVPDPEGNRLELYFELPWYVEQPMRVPVDLTPDDATIMASAEAHARALPGFKSRAEWRAQMARRMGVA